MTELSEYYVGEGWYLFVNVVVPLTQLSAHLFTAQRSKVKIVLSTLDLCAVSYTHLLHELPPLYLPCAYFNENFQIMLLHFSRMACEYWGLHFVYR